MSQAILQAAAHDGDEPHPALSRAWRAEISRPLLIDALLEGGVIETTSAIALRNTLSDSRTPFDIAICMRALASEEALADAMATYCGIERQQDAAAPNFALAKSMSTDFLRASRVCPIESAEDHVLVAIADPTNTTGLRGVEFALGRSAEAVIATANELDNLLRQLSPEPEAETSPADSGDLGDSDRLHDLASAEPAVRLCNRLVADAAKARASDIHVEPEERGYRIRFRIDGVLTERESLSMKQGLAAISRFKILSSLDIAERRRPQDGRFTFPVRGRPVDVRISTTPNVHGESAVLRLLRRDDVSFDLQSLGFSAEAAERLHHLSGRPNGILLLTGPTGSGKTTTLYALLQRLSNRDAKILTIEDPVEYKIAGVSQTQTNPSIGLTFASALRSFLRHDPDIIMVGEMRDLETAKTAVQAALTGHLVLSTLHTNDAPSAVMRLLDMGVEDYLVASTLIGVVGQRLVRRICSDCGRSERSYDSADPICPNCAGTGFSGRLAINEILEIDDTLRSAITAEPTAAKLTRVARAAGFLTMREDGERKISAGVTSRLEVLKAVAE